MLTCVSIFLVVQSLITANFLMHQACMDNIIKLHKELKEEEFKRRLCEDALKHGIPLCNPFGEINFNNVAPKQLEDKGA